MRFRRRVGAACSDASAVWWLAAVMGTLSWFAELGPRRKI